MAWVDHGISCHGVVDRLLVRTCSIVYVEAPELTAESIFCVLIQSHYFILLALNPKEPMVSYYWIYLVTARFGS